VEPGNAHAKAGVTNLRGELIRDRVLLHVWPDLPSRIVASTPSYQ
jgi:hypothetical protein